MQTVERTPLQRGHRWPKDKFRREIDVDDYLLFTDYSGYPTARVGKVVRIGKTGKVHVCSVKLHPNDSVRQIEIKECQSTTKLANHMIAALTMDKLAGE